MSDKSPRELRHSHNCDKCGTKYTHSHPAKDANHDQFANQCPNVACEWSLHKGLSKKQPKTWNEDGEVVEWPARPANNTPAAPRKDDGYKTYKHKTVALTFQRGEIDCDNADHYRMVAEKGKPFKVLQARPAVEILRDMIPGKEASCPCQRAACRAAWKMDRAGPLQTEWVANGLYHKGIGEVKSVPKVVMPVKYRLSKKEFDHLHEEYPDYIFTQVRNDGHDHPVSHTVAQITGYETLRRYKNKGKKILDMHGNPAANAEAKTEHGLDITTAVALVTASDYVRAATKWAGHDYIEAPYLRDMATDEAFGPILAKMDVITSFHTSYYYAMNEIRDVLKGAKPKAVWECVMHKFEGDSGSFNLGELEWKRDGAFIVQTNARTGEQYRHPDNDIWFQRQAWCGTDLDKKLFMEDEEPQRFRDRCKRMDGVAWTKTKVGPNTYRFTATLCPNQAAWDQNNADPAQVAELRYRPATIDVEVGAASKRVVLPSTHKKFYEDLKTAALFKPRDTKHWTAHVATAKSRLKRFEEANETSIDAEVFAGIILASFWDGMQAQAADECTFNWCAQWINRTTANVKAGKSLTQGSHFIDVALGIMESGLTANSKKETVKAIVGGIRNVVNGLM